MITNQLLSEPYTILNGRILWFDGDSSYTVDALGEKILDGSKTWKNDYVIDAQDFSVKRLNELDDTINLVEKSSVDIPDESFKWNIPEKYITLNIREEIYTRLVDELDAQNFSNSDDELVRINRVQTEFKLWEQIGMIDVLRVMLYIVDTFHHNDIVWGTGRGSSCCSYILYLIGIHDVDSVKYGLSTTDFFRV